MITAQLPINELDFAIEVCEAYYEDPRISFGTDTVSLSWNVSSEEEVCCLEEIGANCTIMEIIKK